MERKKRSNLLVILLFIFSISVFIFAIWYFNREDAPRNISTDGKVKAVATIFPIYDILREVGGDRVEATLLLLPGASPHNFEPLPKDVRDLDKTNLVLFVGAGIDYWANDLVLDNIDQGRSNYIAIDMSQIVELRPFGKIETDGEDVPDTNENFDPHFWLSPENAPLIANEIASHLSSLDPVNREYYRKNAQNFINELDEKTGEWKDNINNLENKKMIVFHDAWFYFADYFALDIVAAFEPIAGKSPSPKYLQSILDEIEKNKVDVLFIEPQLDPEIALAMAQGLVDNFEVLDPIGGLDERDSYINLIDYNVKTIIKALEN